MQKWEGFDGARSLITVPNVVYRSTESTWYPDDQIGLAVCGHSTFILQAYESNGHTI